MSEGAWHGMCSGANCSCADQVGSLTNLGPLKIPRRRNKAEVPSYVEAYSLPCGENGNPKTPLVLLSLPSGRLYAHEEGRLSVPGKELQTLVHRGK